MRLSGVGGERAAAHLLSSASAMGVRSFHCSDEYDSFPLFMSAWARARLAGKATLVAKIASPHFDEDRFSARRVRDKIERYLRDLAVEKVDTVQWLLRHDLAQERERQRILVAAAEEIGELAATLKREGKITSFVGFPYSRPIAESLVAASFCDGLALYLNPLEHEMNPMVGACAIAGKPVLAIRPFAGGRVFVETDLGANGALAQVFAFPAVATAVVSASSQAHLDALQPWLGT